VRRLMGVLGGRTEVSVQVGRRMSNLLTTTLRDNHGVTIAQSRQRATAAALIGRGQGRPSIHVVDEGLEVACGAVTRIQRGGAVLGRLVPGVRGAALQDPAGDLIATVGADGGEYSRATWTYPIDLADGSAVGELVLVRSIDGWADLFDWWVPAVRHGSDPVRPSAGVVLRLIAPVPDGFGDLLIATCIDTAVLGRVYRTAP
jgi:hypothetical protein